MRLAHENGEGLADLCGWPPGPVTWRQLAAWSSWFDWWRTVPSRADWHALQVAALLDNVLDIFRDKADRRNAGPADMKLKFREEAAGPPATPAGAEADAHASRSEAVWLGFLGVTKTEGGRDGDDAH